jgi:tetrathionate reductase subunit B
MARYAMVTDLRRCVACHACTVACNGEWDVPPGHARTRVRTTPVAG